MNKALVSIVIPVYCGERYLASLAEELAQERQEWKDKDYPLEICEAIFVEDAPTDDSAEVLRGLAGRFSWLRVLTLSRNFGQHPATVAGLLHSSGDWVVTMDEDLQHPPKYLLSLLRKAIVDGSDLVYAAPTGKVHGSWLRDWSSRGYKALMAQLTGSQNVKCFNSFRAIRGSIARAAAAVCGYDIYLDVAFSWFTNRVDVLPLPLVDLRYLREGRSGYNLRRLLSHARRLVASSRLRLPRLAGLIGLLAVAASAVYGLFVLAQRIFSPELVGAPGWTSLMLVLLFFGGLSALMLGVLIEYVGILLLQSQGKPTFFVVDRRQDDALRQRLAQIV